MKTFTKLILLIIIFPVTSFGQVNWCVPATAIPYSTNMPGITNFTCNTINRNSAAIENYPGNSYVMTGLSTTLVKGNTYMVSVTHTRDAVFFPTARNNIRVWIDYNYDGQLDDPGETVVTLNLQPYGTSTASFTVPASSPTVTTRMRVTAKMSADAGHTFPTPCDIPPDPLQYHGEIEDYTVNIGVTGIDDSHFFPGSVYASQGVLNYALAKAATVNIDVFDMLGKKISSVAEQEKQSAGNYSLPLNLNPQSRNSIFFLRIAADENTYSFKFVSN
jgi:hypothetical protein